MSSESVSQQAPSTCPVCGSDFCCCLEHLFPEQVEFYNRCKPGQAEPIRRQYEKGQAEPQVKLGLEKTVRERLSQESCDWPSSVSKSGDLGLLPKGAAPDPTPQTGQTKRASLLEASANILIGFWVSVGANMLVLPFFPNPGVFREAFIIGLIFTLISFVRSYLLRRLFNLFHIRTNRRSPWKP